MRTTRLCCCLVVLLAIFANAPSIAQPKPSSEEDRQQAMDRDLLEVTIPQLQQFYRHRKYTVTEVVRWHIARIQKYNGIYRAVQTLDLNGALEPPRAKTQKRRAVPRSSCVVQCGAF